MSNRIYNILFHLHTVSGIVISAVLFVIFFTGSFSFFRDEIISWERNQPVEIRDEISLGLDQVLDSIDSQHTLYGRSVSFKHVYNENSINVRLQPSQDSLASEKAKASQFFYLDMQTDDTHTYAEAYSLGEFLYRLHFLAQIPYPAGYYLSGFTAFFFLFAIVTGVLVHWKKIVSNFYLFRPWDKLKTLWTDAHTALGMIGLPFQFVYALTGAFFMIKLLLVAPGVLMLYGGNQGKLYQELGYDAPSYTFENKKLDSDISVDALVAQTKAEWEGFKVTEVKVIHAGDSNMHIVVDGNLAIKDQFTSSGRKIFKASTQEVVYSKSPITDMGYIDHAKNILYRIHFGDYGGYALKVISFILGIVTCFVILSGVMIWLVARDKKNVPEKRKRFNAWVVRIYMGICLSMYPVTAASFVAVQLNNPAGMSFIYQFYFISWLVLSIVFIAINNNAFINRFSLLLGGMIGLLIPLVNGLVTGNWIWVSYAKGYDQIFVVDVFWILISVLTIAISFKLQKKIINAKSMSKAYS
ncbi:PepSY-associated TM helix domain-containing protein [Limibacter armeniacum]|uniref:PepSY-associated TM helix domain-containing protein n=1 Tax=Limibacter armeniacum TaxID=466084 RepID=UPI002FE62789